MSIYFTVTGTAHYLGQDFIKEGQHITLEKDPNNDHDSEAIKAKIPGLGTIGYVANSPMTVIGDSYSAGRIYDKFEDTVAATVIYNIPAHDHGFPYGLVCELEG